jgi:hypothetical protein
MKNNISTTKLAKGDYVTTPETTSEYLTSNKDYVVVSVTDEHGFVIIDDEGEELYCLLFNCQFINGKDWIIKN